jgi:signal transduction histidine kinase
LVLAEEPATSALPQWLELARDYGGELRHDGFYVRRDTKPGADLPDAVSESGIPVSSLAVAKALQRARETGPTQALWNSLVREVKRVPSSFTPMLLDLAEPLTQSRPELQSCLAALRLQWQATERAWEAADVIRRSGRLQGITTTNLWLDFQGSRWLCLLQPGHSWTHTSAGTVTNWFTQARLCPKAAVEQALRKVVVNRQVLLPPYLQLAAELEGESLLPILPISPLTPNPGGKPAEAMTLAQTEGRLTCPATMGNRAEPSSASVEFESMPGRPRFVLRLELADRALLFAAQRRRTWVFGTLVLAAALTAAVGFGAAYRSFHRQLRLSEMKSNFVSSVSHELRAPIASVRLMAESLERGKIIEAPKQQEYFRFIGQECRRLSALIENVLDFSRIEQGRKQYEFEPTDLAELTRHTVQLMETYAAERGVKLMLNECRVSSVEWQGPDSQPSTPNPQLSVDGKAIQQALINLIDNALKHSAKGETVTVGLEVGNAMPSTKLQAPSSRETASTKRPAPGADSWVALWVEDHGAGIPASEQEKIFERFYRLGSELRRETQGVGIGLSIVKHVVEAHGGRVRVRSAVGEGSRFTIELWNAS